MKLTGKYWDSSIDNDAEFAAGSDHFNDLDSSKNGTEINERIKEAKGGQNVLSNSISLNNSNAGQTNSTQVKIVVSRVLSNASDLDNLSKENTAEVYEYKTQDPIAAIDGTDYSNGTPRRMKSAISGKNTSLGLAKMTDVGNKLYVYPGSLEGTDYTTSSEANQVLVIPPTGSTSTRKIIITLLSIACACILMKIIAKEIK